MARRGCVSSHSHLLWAVFCLTLWSLGFSGNAHAATVTVTDLNDSGSGSLRDAITNASSGDTIEFSVTGIITLASGLPTISENLTIEGPGAGSLTISGAQKYTVFTISSGTVVLSGLTIANGNGDGDGGDGGGIFNVGATLTVSDSTFLGNSSTDGGGIFNGGTLTVSNSTFSGNSSANGGGIINDTGTATVSDSTFSGNSASGAFGGGIFNDNGTLTVSNNIFSGNSASNTGGGIANVGTTNASYNVFWKNLANGREDDCSSCTANTHATDADPMLLPLGNYGGPTQTMLPQPGSAAICAGTATPPSPLTLPTSDQRSFPQNASCVDTGAVQTNYLTVTKINDSGSGSLRDAITTANSDTDGDIDFASSLSGESITLGSALPGISGQVNIIGLGASSLTVSGGAKYTVFTVNSGAQVYLSGLTIANGNGTNGGGILNDTGTLTVSSCTFSGNSALNGDGGGIYNSGTLTVSDSTISANSASGGDGGGIYSSGTFTLSNSTFSGNSATDGGGIFSLATLTASDSTFSANAATVNGGGIFSDNGPLVVSDSTFSGNTAAGNFGGGVYNQAGTANSSYNVFWKNLANGGEDDCDGCTSNDNATDADPMLASLGNYGGPTQTMLPLPGSAAICTGQKSLALDTNGNPLTTDQRGLALGVSSYCSSGTVDAGAVQTNYTSIRFTNASSGYSGNVSQDVAPAPVVSVTENGQNIGGVPVTLTLNGSGTANGASSTTVGGTGATFSTFSVDTADSGDTLSATLQVTPSFSLTTNPIADLSITQIATTPTPTVTPSSSFGYGASLPAVSVALTPSNATGITAANFTATLDAGTSTSTVLTVTAIGGNAFALTGIPASLAAGSHSITVDFAGTTDYSASSVNIPLTVNQVNTTVTVTSSGTTAVNQQATFTATVTPSGGTRVPTGTVTFKDTSTSPATLVCNGVTLNSGKATCTVSSLGAGSHVISAVYNGDTNYNASTNTTNTVTQTVSMASASIAVASSPSGSSTVNQSVTFTATITPYNGTTALTPPFAGAVALSGTVSFVDNGNAISACPAVPVSLTNYQATCTTSSLGAGSHSVVATYSGDPNYNGSNNNVTQVVGAIASATALGSSANPSTVNQSVTFTASVTPFNATVKLTGAVTFTDNGGPLSGCTVAWNASTGVASCTTASLPLGPHTIVATYAGDTNYSTSNSSATQVVGQASSSLTLSSSGSPSTINQSVTFTAAVTPTTGLTKLSGTVTFTDNGNAISGCSAVVNPITGDSICTTTSLTVGSHTIVATYANDANYSGSTNTLTQAVNAAPTSTTLISSAPGNISVVNQAVQFTATVAGTSGTTKLSGKLNFTDNGNLIAGCSVAVNPTTGVAICSTSALTKGSHTIAASYVNDQEFSTSSTTLTQTVNSAASSTVLVSSLNPSVALNPQNYHDLVVLTATVTPSSGPVQLSGAVTFTDNGAPIAECQSAVPVNPATGVATCATSSLIFGSHTILAAYNADPNFIASSSSVAQTVQDYTLTASATSSVAVTQGYTSSSDPFSPQSITVSATPIASFAGSLALTCNVVPVSAPTGAVAPLCTVGSATLPITTGAVQQPVAVTIDAGSGTTPVASPGIYSVSLIGTDSATGLTHATASFVVNVRYKAAAITLVSGAVTGNSSTVDFTLPAGVGISAFQCASVTGPTLASSVAPVALSIGCAFSPASAASSTAIQTASVTVTINTGGTTTARLEDHTNVYVAGLLGIPILALLGYVPGGKSSRKILLRFLGIAFVLVTMLQTIGCGGGAFTKPPSVNGLTPPGSYNVLVQGTGSDNQMYEAVVQVNVTR
ncbi:MAG: Ig-like domain repeat protein [Silvibacterium sp.]